MSEGQDKRRRGRPKTLDRQRTIEVAMDTYWREGVFAVSLNEICRRIGVSKPGLYREFGGEDGLMDAVLEHYRREHVTPLLRLMESERPFAQVIEQVIMGSTMDRGRPAGCLFIKMRLAGARLGSTTAARVQAIEQERYLVFEAWFRRGLANNEANPTITPQLATRYFDTQLTTLLMQMAAGEPTELVRAQSRLALRALLRTQAEPVKGDA